MIGIRNFHPLFNGWSKGGGCPGPKDLEEDDRCSDPTGWWDKLVEEEEEEEEEGDNIDKMNQSTFRKLLVPLALMKRRAFMKEGK